MENLILMLSFFVGSLVAITFILLWSLLQSNNRIIETNKQLMIIVAGKDEKPETLRALVASNKPPKKNLPGIADKQGKDKKPANTNFTLDIGVK